MTQTVSAEERVLDSVIVPRDGEAHHAVGLIIRDSAAPSSSATRLRCRRRSTRTSRRAFALNLRAVAAGQEARHHRVRASTRRAASATRCPSTAGSAEGERHAALIDSTLVVYGRTYPLPQQGPIGDIAVDAARGNVFLSNTAFNLLDVWQTRAPRRASRRRHPGRLAAVGPLHLEQSRHAARRELRRYEHQSRVHRIDERGDAA